MSYPNSRASEDTRFHGFIKLGSLIQRSAGGELCDSLSYYVLQVRQKKLTSGLDFEGPTLQEAISCIDTYFDSKELPLVESSFLASIAHYCKLFLCKFYLEGQNLLSSTCRMTKLDLFKKCDKALQSMLESTKQLDEFDRDLYLCYSGTFTEVRNLKYLTKKWVLLSVQEDEEEPTVIFKKDWDCKCYSPLFKAMILSINKVIETLKLVTEDSELIAQLHQICNNILSVGRLYQLFNPSKEELDKAGKELVSLLTSPDRGGPNSPYHEDALNQVKELFEDCRIVEQYELLGDSLLDKKAKSELRNRKYCRYLSRAIAKVKRKGFDFKEKDYYLSNKTDPCRNSKYPHLTASLLKSGFEYDPFAGCAFDRVTGYKSYYLSYDEAIEIGTREIQAVTRMITNPSKCKGRGIHLAYNSIQDRCNLIHRILREVLDYLPTDCTTHQPRGVYFLTARSIRKKRQTEGYNLYASDFTNATDTLSQYVQELILSFIFPKEIVEFWHELAIMPKIFIFYNEKNEMYIQTSGQPQGYLGSFDAFALVHHVIMLCTMKASGLGDQESTDFYRVLGDDSAICSIRSDPKSPTLDSLRRKDFTPVWGRSVLDTYFCLCLWSNFLCNFDKTKVVRSDDPVALIDFAKVTIREGRIFSPIPVRLFFSSMGKNEATLIPGFLWNTDHEGWVNKVNLRDKLSQVTECDFDFIDSLYFSGIIPCFKSLEIVDSERNEVTLGRVALSYILASIQQNICCSFLTDTQKETVIRNNRSVPDYYKVFASSSKEVRKEFKELLVNSKINENHKVFYALLRNKDIEEYLNCLYSGILELPDSLQWSPYLEVTDDMRDSIIDLSQMIEVIQANPDAMNVRLLSSVKPILDSLREWDKYTFRSDYKKAKIFSSLANTSKQVYDRLFSS